MDPKSLRANPLGKSEPSNPDPGQDFRDTPLFDVIGTPHPDNESPENSLEKHTVKAPPKDNLGARGFGGA